MTIAIYLLMIPITFFLLLFVCTKVIEPIDHEDFGEFMPVLLTAAFMGCFWPITFPLGLMVGLGWYFIKFLNKGKK